MKIYKVKKYQESDSENWNAFIAQAKNATFLFHRDFMEYHKDHRFEDYSLIVLDGEKWVAVLPANRVGDEIFSHQGLTYGGLVYSEKLGAEVVREILDMLLNFLIENKFRNLILKLIPNFYHLSSSNEIDYFLFYKKAQLINRSMNLAINYNNNLHISKSKLKHFKRISKLGITIIEQEDCTLFWNSILIPRLQEKHNVSPVHSLEEINSLKLEFSKNIKQFNAYFQGEIVAGITLFCSQKVVKSQYGATSSQGEKIRALDYLFISLIKKFELEYSYFDMGVVDDKDMFNKGLLKQKEELGCSVWVQDTYKINLI